MLFFKRNKNKQNKNKAEEPANTDAQSSSVPAQPQASEQAVAPASEHTSEPQPASAPEPQAIPEETQAIPEESQPIAEEPRSSAAEASITQAPPAQNEEPQKPKKMGFFARIKQGLSRTSAQFSKGLGNLLLGKKAIDDELLEEIETQLLVADVGVDATTDIIDSLTAKVERKQLADSGALYLALQNELHDLLKPVEQPLSITAEHSPYVILVVGVNGVGKTTTIGKLAKRLQNEGKSVMLAAGDTFRAAAVEQLQVWGERNNVPVIAQHTGADSASVIFDAVNAAKSRNVDVIIADTAGRLHNKNHLMDELGKVRRVIGKLDASAPHEVLLVLDAGTGQNAVSQADIFRDTAGVTGIALTKLDGTAKGGVIFALTKKHNLPIRFIGVGESIDDLQPFNAKAFVDALFGKTEE